ncbi:MAG: ABC transporter ATP-binding protein [Alphaproteobacteria bacterium]|nr:ABC transporter ATP-binding protein [Alphaproteobacteria bacterium]
MITVVEVSSVRKDYGSGLDGNPFTAVKDVSFSVGEGEVVCICGKTGCGKSTLVNMLLGLDPPSAGSIRIDGLSPSADFFAMRGKLAAVFQTDRLLPWRTVIDNAAIGLEVANVPKDERYARARVWLSKVGLSGWEKAYPHQLSGGMRQRVAISRAFVTDPKVILLDEAFGHLDEVTAHKLRQDCMALITESRTAAIVVTHNITEALELGTRVLVLGKPARVISSHELVELRRLPDWAIKRDQVRSEIFRTIDSESFG